MFYIKKLHITYTAACDVKKVSAIYFPDPYFETKLLGQDDLFYSVESFDRKSIRWFLKRLVKHGVGFNAIIGGRKGKEFELNEKCFF